MGNYWRPQWKWQLVDWFMQNVPGSKRWKWEKMTLVQLRGKYKEVRDGESV